MTVAGLGPIAVDINRGSDFAEKADHSLGETENRSRDFLRHGEIEHDLEIGGRQIGAYRGADLILMRFQVSDHSFGEIVDIHQRGVAFDSAVVDN